MKFPARTQVAIVGAGPAGLLLSHLLRRQSIDNVVLESRSREYVEQRQRAGILEHGTIEVLREIGADARMNRDGLPHEGIELRFVGRSHRIDFADLVGREVMIWAQTQVVQDLVALRLAHSEPLAFDTEVLAVTDVETEHPRMHHAGGELVADVVVGADGFHGVARRAIPEHVVRTYGRVYPYSWLGITAEVAPSCDELIYARHERGFALHSMRSPSVSRLYLQVPNDIDASSWSENAVWDELAVRLALDDGTWKLDRGPIVDQSVTPMRSHVAEPLRHRRLFLAGDAAHIVPPTGAKGLNLAVADVRLLAAALADWYASADTTGVDTYSQRALARVWRAEHFSSTMTTCCTPTPTQTRSSSASPSPTSSTSRAPAPRPRSSPRTTRGSRSRCPERRAPRRGTWTRTSCTGRRGPVPGAPARRRPARGVNSVPRGSLSLVTGYTVDDWFDNPGEVPDP